MNSNGSNTRNGTPFPPGQFPNIASPQPMHPAGRMPTASPAPSYVSGMSMPLPGVPRGFSFFNPGGQQEGQMPQQEMPPQDMPGMPDRVLSSQSNREGKQAVPSQGLDQMGQTQAQYGMGGYPMPWASQSSRVQTPAFPNPKMYGNSKAPTPIPDQMGQMGGYPMAPGASQSSRVQTPAFLNPKMYGNSKAPTPIPDQMYPQEYGNQDPVDQMSQDLGNMNLGAQYPDPPMAQGYGTNLNNTGQMPPQGNSVPQMPGGSNTGGKPKRRPVTKDVVGFYYKTEPALDPNRLMIFKRDPKRPFPADSNYPNEFRITQTEFEWMPENGTEKERVRHWPRHAPYPIYGSEDYDKLNYPTTQEIKEYYHPLRQDRYSGKIYYEINSKHPRALQFVLLELKKRRFFLCDAPQEIQDEVQKRLNAQAKKLMNQGAVKKQKDLNLLKFVASGHQVQRK
ncbi:hypothetical protein M011DRAFT_136672 [Sporormia fimetaria CBS 119925]|uniref:Uncharacterized protein n=1 Tax=Sporormia fimetaria CBS 119925 TaxID=1340428 RepID=A0A6A6V7Z2_9PLEO|nr:hypothetical protein M011DRAFT_136672 [Sporormia fimetaria CBS 119925]